MDKRRGRDEWGQLIGEWARSGEKADAFAARIGVASNTLYRWRATLKGAAKRRAPALSQIVEVRPSGFVADTRFELEVAGRVVRVPAAFDEAALQRLLRVVEAAR